MRARPIVAIDGPSGVGKSTVARRLSASLDFSYVDTGALYRTVAWLADKHDVDWSTGSELADIAGKHELSFDSDGNLSVDGEPIGDRIRTPRISRGASAVARHPEVRGALLSLQRQLGEAGGVVLEGRDIGTVVFADAEIKFFLNASVAVRARRRFLELEARGEKITLEEVEQEQARRDETDRNRAVSPLRQAEDAVEIMCDEMTVDEVVETMVQYIHTRFPLTSK
ncbi:MAG: (d)CMP kinase [Deltaproteobacteria bacterium]|nr:(d)CMP kinase [Deltaproteobacteria bacterium]